MVVGKTWTDIRQTMVCLVAENERLMWLGGSVCTLQNGVKLG